jgi:hypothetical protein
MHCAAYDDTTSPDHSMLTRELGGKGRNESVPVADAKRNGLIVQTPQELVLEY